MFKSKILILAAVSFTALAQNDNTKIKYEHPLISGYGGIVPLRQAAEQPQPYSKVLLDITSDNEVHEVIKGLDRAALIANQYASVGAGPLENMKIAVVLHGDATKAALSNQAYVKHSSTYKEQRIEGNPNLELINKLLDAGVEITVCGQAMAHRGIKADEIAKGIEIAVSAATVNINKQMNGYAYIPF